MIVPLVARPSLQATSMLLVHTKAIDELQQQVKALQTAHSEVAATAQVRRAAMAH